MHTKSFFYDLVTNGPVFIAEVADSHYGDLARAEEMIFRAKAAGFDIVKFQHHIPDLEIKPDAPMSKNFSEPLYEFLKKNALSIEQHYHIHELCTKVGIEYLCTPFTPQAAIEIEPLVRFFKVGSGEFDDYLLHDTIAATGKPLLISSGMSTLAEVKFTVRRLVERSIDFSLMHCISAYPAPRDRLNLGLISSYRTLFPDRIIGYSDHSVDQVAIFSAVALGADIIEVHVKLDDSLKGPDTESSWNFETATELIRESRKVKLMCAANREVLEEEEEIKAWARHSLYYASDMKIGERIERCSLLSMRPPSEIQSSDYEAVIGKRLGVGVKKGEPVRRGHLIS